MPQMDRRRHKIVPIDFSAVERLDSSLINDSISLILITDGKANIILNDEPLIVHAPCVLCLSALDKLKIIDNSLLSAQSFSMNPAFMKSRTTFRQMKKDCNKLNVMEYTQDTLMLFYTRNDYFNGLLSLSYEAYLKIFEWSSIIGTEIMAQSDGRWTCRIRQYFLSILNILDQLYEKKEAFINNVDKETPVDMALEYINTHYMDEIDLEKMSELTHTNRTTLNRLFKQRTGQTVIDFLLSYRLRVARELLAHTGLTVDEIARKSGFVYDTYLIRQFTKKSGETPTEYRKSAKEKYGIVVPPKT